MLILNKIPSEVQKIIEAIAAVVNIEVTVYDDTLHILASTGGKNHNRIGEKIRGFVIREVLKTGKHIINENPGTHPVCRPCKLFGNCPELADISCPIFFKGKTIGAISLTAFEQKQRTHLLQNKNDLVRFVSKMSELISSKLGEKELFEQVNYLADQLKVTIFSVHEGVIAIDQQGYITQFNRTAQNILNVSEDMAVNRHVRDIFPETRMLEVLKTGQGYMHEEMVFPNSDGKKIHIVSSAEPIIQQGKVVGVVATFSDIADVRRLVNDMMGEYKHVNLDDIHSVSWAMDKVKDTVRRVAKSNSTILITGESGVGKELFARAIHAESLRRKGPFMAINCAAIPDTLLESELFGYDEGAFTGAKKKGKPGKFELANGGSIFLDEIGDMPLHLQAKILRVLEDCLVERVGGTTPIPVDVRLIAATNRNLDEMVVNGEFRKDLYYRLNVIPLHIPPLRERKEDIPILIHFFLNKYGRILNKGQVNIEDEVTEILLQYDWPGNVRELENTLEYCVNMAAGDTIDLSSLPPRILKFCQTGKKANESDEVWSLEEQEKCLLSKALARFGTTYGGKKAAAEALGINIATLYRKLKKYGMNI